MWRDMSMADVRDLKRAVHQLLRAKIITQDGREVPLLRSDKSDNAVFDLRNLAATATSVPLEAPVLTVTVDDAQQELDNDWTLPATYDAVFLERGTDGTTFAPLAELGGTVAAYEDTDVTPGTEYFYRVRGISGGTYSPWSNVASGELAEEEEPEVPCVDPVLCAEALVLPFFYDASSVYPDKATAEAILANPLIVASGLAYSSGETTNATEPSSFTAAIVGSTLDVDAVTPYPVISFTEMLTAVWVASVNLVSGDTLTLDYSGSSTPHPKHVKMELFTCVPTFVSQQDADDSTLPTLSGSFNFTVPSTGEFIVRVTWDQQAAGGPYNFTTTLTTSAVLSSSGAFSVNPVIARFTNGACVGEVGRP